MVNRYLAVDLGASGGRLILGSLKEGRLYTEEIHRFKNGLLKRNGHLCWDYDYLFMELIKGLKMCGQQDKIPVSLGIDTWAVDFVLLDEMEQLIGDTISYRDIRTRGLEEKLYCIVPEEELYQRTGIQRQPFNTIFQLLAIKEYEPIQFKRAKDFLMVPDYFNFLLTGINHVMVSVESKVFGIGLESYTVGSHEFYMNYASQKGLLCLLDNGHYHPTETISDKISSLLLFSEKAALHVTRPVRWDSDHVVLFDDELKEIAKEIVRNDALDRVLIGLDYFDASINRISAWVVGMRNMQKALLYALLLPNERLAGYQEEGSFTRLMMLQEELKTYPLGDVWNYFCLKNRVPEREEWFAR